MFWTNTSHEEKEGESMNKVNTIEVIWNDLLVGRLALTKDRLCAFEYSNEFINNGISISPFELPLQKGVMIAKRNQFEGGFGVFDDCLPDGWGLLILNRYLQKKGIKIGTLSLLERLCIVGSGGRGALEFRPENKLTQNIDYTDFENLSMEAEHILDSDDFNINSIDEFLHRGGSPGGARPKVFTKINGKEYLVKFRAKNDPKNIGVQEYEYSLLAKKCGIEMPETKLIDDRFFAVERYDRTENGKLHVISVAGLIGADYRLPCIDYQHIFQICSILTHNNNEMWKIFRLMVFNYLIDNKDDHAKNFSFIYRNNNWHFAPAYDLLPSDGINGYRTTSINDKIEIKDDDVIALAAKVGLGKNKAKKILEEMKEIVYTTNIL